MKSLILAAVLLLFAAPAATAANQIWTCKLDGLIVGVSDTQNRCRAGTVEAESTDEDPEFIRYRERTGEYAPTRDQIDAQYNKFFCRDREELTVIGLAFDPTIDADAVCALKREARP